MVSWSYIWSHHLERFTVGILIWPTATGRLCHRKPRLCSVFPSQILSCPRSWLVIEILTSGNKTGATSRAGTAYLLQYRSSLVLVGFVLLNLWFSLVFCWPLFVVLSCFVLLYCIYFHLLLLITPLISLDATSGAGTAYPFGTYEVTLGF